MRRRERPVVLVAARDTAVRRLVAGALESDGFTTADSGIFSEPVDAVADIYPDAVVLQAGLADTPSGEELRARSREESIPVLLLGRRPGPIGVVEALDHGGADDYVAPPFDPVELGARVRALVRRRGMQIASGTRQVGRATVDLDRRAIRVGAGWRSLPRSDWAVLMRLLADEGIPVPYDELLSSAFGSAFRDDLDRLRAAVARLRRALGAGPGEAGPIRTVRGIGYALTT